MNSRRVLAGSALALMAIAGCGEDASSPPPDPAAVVVPYPEYRSAMNLAAGLMNQFEFEPAEEAYLQIMEAWPASRDARRNHAIAVLNQSEPDAQERAIELLDAMTAEWLAADGSDRGRDLSALYIKGLGLLYLGDSEAARDLFIECATRASTDAYAAFFAGQCLELEGRHEEALAWYLRAIELDEYLRSPLLGANRCLARLDRAEEGESLLEKFLALGDNPRGKLAEFKYTRMGPLGEARAAPDLERPAVPPSGPLFATPTPMPVSGVPAGFSATLEPAADLNRDGILDFVAISSPAEGVPLESLALSNGADGESVAWSITPFADAAPGGSDAEVFGLASATHFWADFDNDGLTDVAIGPTDGSEPYWWRQREELRWSRESFGGSDAGAPADERSEAGEARQEVLPVSGGLRLLAAADFDHDGDVDLLASDAEGTRLLLNRRDGDADRATTWVHRPLADSIPNASSAALGDFDDDGDLDFMLLGAAGPAQVWLNDLLWSWRRDERFAAIEATSPIEAVWFRDDDSGDPRLATLAGDATSRQLTIWSLDAATPQPVEPATAVPAAASLAAIDLAGSGRTNLLCLREVDGGGKVLEVHDARGNSIESIGPVPSSTSLAVPDGRGAVLISSGDTLEWRDAGPGRMPLAALWFSGRIDPSQQMRTNASGIGVRGDARTVGTWQSRTALPWRGGGGGQPLEPVLYGLSGHPRIELLSIDWTDGVLQSEVDLASGVQTVVETQRQISSCPVIFAWNGDRFEFVTDALGVGGLGYLAAIEVADDGSLIPIYPEPRPLESVLLGTGDAIAPRNGRFEIRLGEPMEEACYLDAARLIAWDLPEGWSIALDERLGIGGPSPTGEARFFRHAMHADEATMAFGDEVIDVAAELSAADHRAADPGAADSRFIGRTAQRWTLTLSFPEPLESRGGDLALLLDGWVEYPYSSTSFAMWQAEALPEAPTFEALDPRTGAWVVLVAEFGYPAGMPRQACFPLDRASLPPGCDTLRIRSSNEIYLDQAQLAWFEPCPSARRTSLPLAEASVADAGFAFRPPLPQRRPWYDYDRRVPLWDVRMQQGFYTAFGECTPLLASTDDAVAIFGGGEEIRLEFAADLKALASGWSRRWVLELDGWCKDMDPFTGLGATLEPLPLRAGSVTTPARDALHHRFNTRFAGGR